MKKIKILLIAIIFSIFIIPSSVFADSVYIFQYFNPINDINEIEKETIINTILNNEKVLKLTTYPDRVIIDLNNTTSSFSNPNLANARYLVASSQSNPYFGIYNSKIRIYFGGAFVYYFDENLNLLNDSAHYTALGLYMGNEEKFYNSILYSSYKEILFKNKSTTIEFYVGSELYTILNHEDNFLNIFNLSIPEITFEINPIHEISISILGNDIPDEYNFLYLISDYLIIVSFVIVVCSPLIIIVKLLKMRW